MKKSSPRALSDPHVSPEPPNILPEHIPRPPSKTSSRSSGKTDWTQKVGHFMYKKKSSTLTRENLEEFARRQAEAESKRYSSNSPYYKGLTDFSKALQREKQPGTSPEAESTPVVAHEPHNLISPYYKGFSRTKSPPSPLSPGRESQAGTYLSSSSRTSLSLKMQEWSNSFFLFKTKDEKPPTMIKVYSTGHVHKEKHLRERGSERSPTQSPPRPISPPAALWPPPKSPPAAMLPPKSSPPLQPEQPSPKRVVLNATDTSEPKEEKKYFWADKYRPLALEDFICNREKANEIRNMVNDEDCHHFIFEGQPGVGKRTMIWALLREAFGPDKIQARDECKTFDLKGEAVSSIIVNVKESSQHVEVNLSELKGYEKHVIVELIKETNNKLPNNTKCNHDNCRAIILYEADKLSTDALLYIRWLLERFKGCHKIFFCCNDHSKLQPIKALCNLVQLLPPSDKEIVEVLEFIARKEEIELPQLLAERIAINSKNNLRQAIRSFEATWKSNSCLKEDQVIMTGWEDDIADIAKSVVEKQSPKQLYDIRRKLQNLIEHSVSPEFIFETLVVELKKNADETSHQQIDKTYKEYNGSEKRISRKKQEETDENPKKKIIQQFMSIEEFIAKFMSCYKVLLAKKAQELKASQGQPL